MIQSHIDVSTEIDLKHGLVWQDQIIWANVPTLKFDLK